VNLLSNLELKSRSCVTGCVCVCVTGYGKSTRLSNCKFHECVKVVDSRTLHIHPPEGEVVLAITVFLLL